MEYMRLIISRPVFSADTWSTCYNVTFFEIYSFEILIRKFSLFIYDFYFDSLMLIIVQDNE